MYKRGFTGKQFKAWKKQVKKRKNKERRIKYYNYKQQLDIVVHLDNFYKGVISGQITIDLLKDFSCVYVPNSIPYHERREQFRRTGSIPSRCFVCSNPSQQRHHIILLKNGGSNHRRNIIKLCIDCHKEIHPYLNTWQNMPNLLNWTTWLLFIDNSSLKYRRSDVNTKKIFKPLCRRTWKHTRWVQGISFVINMERYAA